MIREEKFSTITVILTKTEPSYDYSTFSVLCTKKAQINKMIYY